MQQWVDDPGGRISEEARLGKDRDLPVFRGCQVARFRYAWQIEIQNIEIDSDRIPGP